MPPGPTAAPLEQPNTAVEPAAEEVPAANGPSAIASTVVVPMDTRELRKMLRDELANMKKEMLEPESPSPPPYEQEPETVWVPVVVPAGLQR